MISRSEEWACPRRRGHGTPANLSTQKWRPASITSCHYLSGLEPVNKQFPRFQRQRRLKLNVARCWEKRRVESGKPRKIACLIRFRLSALRFLWEQLMMVVATNREVIILRVLSRIKLDIPEKTFRQIKIDTIGTIDIHYLNCSSLINISFISFYV